MSQFESCGVRDDSRVTECSQAPSDRSGEGSRVYLSHLLRSQLKTMEDDLIVVDDHDLDLNAQNTAGPSKETADTQVTPAVTGRPQRAATLRARRQSSPAYSDSGDTTSGRAIRSSAKAKAAPKLKLKLSEKAAALAPGMSFLGPYDRELDSDDEELSFEEQFILRMPPGEDCGKLREMVAAREISPDVWFKFKGTPYGWGLSRYCLMA
jgi:transcription initiation factor TFIID subunit 7